MVLDAAANTGGSRLGDWAWKILDRLVIDLSKNVNVIGMETEIRAKLLTEWLNFTINSWRLLLDSQTITTNGTTFLTVGQVLTKLESFDPHILPDVQTCKTIINAKIAQDPSDAAPFAERMLERMNH